MTMMMMEEMGDGSLVKQFLERVTNNVVLCVMSNELGEMEMETVLTRLNSWSIETLISHSTVNLLFCGEKVRKENGDVIHTLCRPPSICHNPLEDKYWAAVHLLQRATEECDRSVILYILMNVGREGWCVLTTRFHTLVNLFENLSSSTDDSVDGGKEWWSKFHERVGDNLVPIASPRLRPSKLALQPNCHYVYVDLGDYCFDWRLRAIFDTSSMRHKVHLRMKNSQSQVEVQHDEVDARQFLVVMRILLKGLPESMVCLFLRNFTQVNAITWDEALGILSQDVTKQQQPQTSPAP